MPEYGWSLQPEDWEKALELISGKTFAKMQMRLDMQMAVPNSSGVYVVCCKPNKSAQSNLWDQLYNGLYVGQAKDLRARFKWHMTSTDSGPARIRAAYTQQDYWYLTVPEEHLNLYERTLQIALGPSSNKIKAPMTAKLSEPQPANP